mgnify:CR=1 FL=1
MNSLLNAGDDWQEVTTGYLYPMLCDYLIDLGEDIGALFIGVVTEA